MLRDRFLQRLNRQPGYQRSGQFPAHHFARVGIENHGEVDKLTMQSDVGDVGHPKLIDSGRCGLGTKGDCVRSIPIESAQI